MTSAFTIRTALRQTVEELSLPRRRGTPLSKVARYSVLLAGTIVGVVGTVRAQPVVAGMHMTFDEEFKTFDWAAEAGHRWMTRYANDGAAARTLTASEQEYYSDASVGEHPFSLHDGALDITASPGLNKRGQPYNSGLITTFSSFNQLYGYFEMRAQLPAGPGLWPAFWMLPKDHSWPPELDGVEMLGRDPGTLYFSTHTKIDGHDVGHTIPVKVPDVSKGFHTYGVDWRPDTITWYFDDKAVASAPTPPDMHKPMYMLINLAVGKSGSWPGAPDERTRFPAHLLIKWIHAYNKAGS
jgi:beta-glucanase (GH16 family)